MEGGMEDRKRLILCVRWGGGESGAGQQQKSPW